jgi:very-short-patch-repair endonuclease
LQRYLEYAGGYGRAAVEDVGPEIDSDFEAEVADRLRARGYQVDYQVGVSGFRIDLGVRHPDKPEMFLAGIECDGAQYHSSKSARDRDRLREEVLRGLGWNVLRVWSTDWFENPDEETRKLALKLEKVRMESGVHVTSDDYHFANAAGDDGSATVMTSNATDMTLPSDPGGTTPAPEPSGAKPEEMQVLTEPISTAPPIYMNIGRMTTNEGIQALREFRETVIAKEMTNWEPERSILREGMIETFVTMRLKDPDDWFRRVPLYQRQNTNPLEKSKYIEKVCEIVERIESA